MDSKKVGIGIGIVAAVAILIGVILISATKGENTYEVTFKNGNFTEVVEVKENDTVARPADPTKEGYTFEGWYYNGTRFDFTTKITENITLEARWTSDSAKKWVITFDANGGKSVESLNVEDGKTIVDIPTTAREGYTFVGWYYNNQKFDFNTKITKDITLTAKWEKVEKEEPDNTGTTSTTKYTVKFDSNGGTSVKSVSVEKNKTVTKPTDPTRDGYTFIGWYNGESLFDFSSKITKNITLTAKWEKNPVISHRIEKTDSYVNQIIIFVLKDNVEVDGIVDIKVSSGEVIKDVEIPKEGYTTNGYKVKEVTNVRVK